MADQYQKSEAPNPTCDSHDCDCPQEGNGCCAGCSNEHREDDGNACEGGCGGVEDCACAAKACGCAGEGEECDCEGEDGDCACDCAGEGCGCGCACAGEGEDCDCEGCDCSCDCEAGVDPGWIDERAPAVDTPTPDEILELVVSCVRFVNDALGIELDFTPDTLPVLDHYLSAARESLADRLALRELVWRCAGAYFGELVRRRYNGFWALPNPDVHTWRINLRHVLLSFNPIGVVAEAMAGSDHADGPSGVLRLARPDQAEVAKRLAEIPPLPENQYFLLSTRLEVIDTVVEHLRIRLEQNGQADFEFDPDDYANDLEPYGVA